MAQCFTKTSRPKRFWVRTSSKLLARFASPNLSDIFDNVDSIFYRIKKTSVWRTLGFWLSKWFHSIIEWILHLICLTRCNFKVFSILPPFFLILDGWHRVSLKIKNFYPITPHISPPVYKIRLLYACIGACAYKWVHFFKKVKWVLV